MRRSKIRAGVTVACIAVALLAPQANAATARVPDPTLTIATSVGGQRLPVSPISGAWKTKSAGRDSTLSLSGYAVTGTKTDVTAVWYSSWRTAKRHKTAFQFDLNVNHGMYLPGSPNNTWYFEEAWRGKTGGWHAISDTDTDYFWLLGGYRELVTDQASFEKSQLMQWRVTMRLRLFDTSSDSWTAHIRVM